ncbi:MAG: hypothetical protein QXI86_05740 [Ignisphaera sp.]
MNLSIEDILEKFELLVDASALALLHSREYKNLVPVILAKTKIHVSILSLIDFLTYLYYIKGINSQIQVVDILKQIYDIVNVDDKIVSKVALMKSDLLHHAINPDNTDLINVAIALEKGYILVTVDPADYEIYRRYGLIVMSVEELVSKVKELVISESSKR